MQTFEFLQNVVSKNKDIRIEYHTVDYHSPSFTTLGIYVGGVNTLLIRADGQTEDVRKNNLAEAAILFGLALPEAYLSATAALAS